MSGERDLDKLLAQMQPILLPGEYVFCTLKPETDCDWESLNPLGTFWEAEGLSLLLDKFNADAAGLSYSSSFRGISLTVHSSLEAVGLTAAIAGKLASHGIPANVIAAHYHDHVFVPTDRAEQAMQLLTATQKN